MNQLRKRVLIVDDDEHFRQALVTTLEGAGFETLTASNGKVARDIIRSTKFDVILSDMQMPYLTGVELIEWIKDNIVKPPAFILMTGFSHLIETKRAHELGVEHFLPKPFDSDVLIDTIKSIFNRHMGVDTQFPIALENLYCKVSLEDFISEKNIEMDVFIKLSNSKYLKISHKGGKLDESRIIAYKEKGIDHLFVLKQDFHKIIGFNIKLSKIIAANQNLDPEKKKRFLTHTAGVILENSFVNELDEQSIQEAKEFLMTSMEALTEDGQTFSVLESINNHSDYLYAHSLGVSMIATMIAKAMGWTSVSNLFKVSFAGLMHDVGKKEFDPSLLEKSRSQLTYKERQLLETHTLRGKEILDSIKSTPTEVVLVAYQHHENVIGQGYPRQLSKNEIHPMSRVVSVADEFCNHVLKNAHHPGMPPENAISLMEQFKFELFDQDCFFALKNLVAKKHAKSA